MPGLLDKLNTLVKASLNNIVSDSPLSSTGPAGARVPAARLGKDIDKEIAALRQHIDEALSQEDTMKDRLGGMQQQIDGYDQQADAALQNGDEPTARYLIQQMKRQQQLATMLDSELREHRQATSDLIERVNTLDAMVSDARREAANQQPDPSDLDNAPQTDTSSSSSLSSMLREARERGEDSLAARSEPVHHVPITVQGATDSATDKATIPAEPAPQRPAVPINSPAAPVHVPLDAPPVGVKVSVTSDSEKPPAAPIINSVPPADRDDTDDDIARRRARLSKRD